MAGDDFEAVIGAAIALDEQLESLVLRVSTLVDDGQLPSRAEARHRLQCALSEARDKSGRADPSRWLASVPPDERVFSAVDLANREWRRREDERHAREAERRHFLQLGAAIALKEMNGGGQ